MADQLPGFGHQLRRFYLGRDRVSGVGCYLIPRADAFFYKERKLAARILADCEAVQESVWNRKYSTHRNVFIPGSLLIFIEKDRILGFMTCIGFDCGPDTHALYYADFMLSRAVQGRRLTYLAYLIFLLEALGEQALGTKRLINVIVSGHIGMFQFFQRNPFFKTFPVTKEDNPACEKIQAFLQHDFPKGTFDARGIMRGAWLPQRAPETSVWPADRVEDRGWPTDIKYENGDVIHRNIELIPGAGFELRQMVERRMEKDIADVASSFPDQIRLVPDTNQEKRYARV